MPRPAQEALPELEIHWRGPGWGDSHTDAAWALRINIGDLPGGDRVKDKARRCLRQHGFRLIFERADWVSYVNDGAALLVACLIRKGFPVRHTGLTPEMFRKSQSV